MAFQKVFDAGQAEVRKFENIGDKLEGRYMGSFPHEGDYGPTKKHIFDTPKGAVVVFGQKHLTDLLPSVKPGTMVRITFKEEKAPQKKGRHPMKLFMLEQDQTNFIAVETVQAEQSEDLVEADNFTPVDDSDDDELDSDINAADELTPARPSRPAQAAPTPSAERQKKVQDLLKNARARS